jgi:DNA-binding YbaB/EbfC family protein
MKQIQSMQGKVSEMQERLKDIRVTGSSGGDMVRIEIDGQFSVRAVSVSPEAVDPAEVQMLEDLILAAFSDGLAKLKEKMREEASGLAGGLNLPPGMLGL